MTCQINGSRSRRQPSERRPWRRIRRRGDALLGRAVQGFYDQRDRGDNLQIACGKRDILLARARDGLRAAEALVAELEQQIDDLEAQVCRLQAAAGVPATIIQSLRRQLSAAVLALGSPRPRPGLPDLEEVVRRVVALRRLDEGAVGDCPWCGELDGLYLFTASQLWTCVGCGAVGDAAAFVARYAPDRRAAG
jgi:hypothetical protein